MFHIAEPLYIAEQEVHWAGIFRSEHDDESNRRYWHYFTHHWSSGWTIKSELSTTVCHTRRECWVCNFFCFYCSLSSSSSTDLPYPNRQKILMPLPHPCPKVDMRLRYTTPSSERQSECHHHWIKCYHGKKESSSQFDS